jgi:NhaP-type Na+/H+ or K+/H+ antiporter
MELLVIGLMCGLVIGYAFGLGIHKLDIWERTRSKLEE